MRFIEFVRVSALALIVAAGIAGPASAFDDKVFDTSTGVRANSSPWDVFKFGFSAYKNGHKAEAIEAYRYAAEKGQLHAGIVTQRGAPGAALLACPGIAGAMRRRRGARREWGTAPSPANCR